jgi:hypothetical protein
MSKTPEKTSRLRIVADEVSRRVDQWFRDHRTYDNKELTEGEIMVALGHLIGHHCKDQDRVTIWCRAIHSTASQENAAKRKTIK